MGSLVDFVEAGVRVIWAYKVGMSIFRRDKHVGRVGTVKCWSCRRRIRRRDNFCFGCRHFVCVRCCGKYDHFAGGRHAGRRHERQAAISDSSDRQVPKVPRGPV